MMTTLLPTPSRCGKTVHTTPHRNTHLVVSLVDSQGPHLSTGSQHQLSGCRVLQDILQAQCHAKVAAVHCLLQGIPCRVRHTGKDFLT